MIILYLHAEIFMLKICSDSNYFKECKEKFITLCDIKAISWRRLEIKRKNRYGSSRPIASSTTQHATEGQLKPFNNLTTVGFIVGKKGTEPTFFCASCAFALAAFNCSKLFLFLRRVSGTRGTFSLRN